MIPVDGGDVLLPVARAAIADALGASAAPVATPAWLDQDGAVFVTLTQDGALRGCIGSLTPYRSLRDDVHGNAVAAATRDPRFTPLRADELERTHVEVSVLSTPEPIAATSKEEAIAALRPGIDGVILECDGHRGTFLPQVWEKIPDPGDFLDHLARKARLPDDRWDPATRLWRYTVTVFAEGTTKENP